MTVTNEPISSLLTDYHSLNYVSCKLRKAVAADLRTVDAASTVDGASIRVNEFDEKWRADYPTIVKSWP
jgi:putative transposase